MMTHITTVSTKDTYVEKNGREENVEGGEGKEIVRGRDWHGDDAHDGVFS